MGYLPHFSIHSELVLYRLMHYICTLLQAERLSYQRHKGKERLNNASHSGKLLFQLDKICKDIGIHNTNSTKSSTSSTAVSATATTAAASAIASATASMNTAINNSSAITCSTPQEAMQQIHIKINEFQEYYSNINQPKNVPLKFPENFPKILSSTDMELNEKQIKNYQMISEAVYKVSN